MNQQSSIQKCVAITGGASGLGKAMALHFAQSGWKVAIADIHDERGKETEALLNKATNDAFYTHVDVRQVEDISAWKDAITGRWGKLDVLINNAGVGAQGGIEDTSIENWQWILDINVMGVVRGCNVFTSLFKQQGHGHIVNIASLAGLVPLPGVVSYSASKSAVIALSESICHELAPYNINVTVVCPSFFQTNIAENSRSSDKYDQGEMKKWMSSSSVSAEDIAKKVYLAVEEKRYLVLTHNKHNVLWRLKKYAPFLYNPIATAIGKKNAETHKSTDNASSGDSTI